MLNNHGFDLWSGNYDKSVKDADDNNQYPFAGYTNLMNAIYGTVMNVAPAKVLDIGFGTGNLTAKLYDGGNTISGIDFSAEMIKIAQEKMPAANLIQWDFTKGLPEALWNDKFDFIISTYAFHHLAEDEKFLFITQLLPFLEPNGTILIGDVCFKTKENLLACQSACGNSWDDDEIYFVLSEFEKHLNPICKLTFHEFSFCSGIVEIQKNEDAPLLKGTFYKTR